ncbi:MAG: serine protease [Paracoccaceae bacterium]|nr:serine protease [Paracoccaceae bacterium]
MLAEVSPLFRYHATVVNGDFLGSSFELESGLIATNAHVVRGIGVGSSIKLVVSDRRKPVRAVLVAVSEKIDLALLQIPAGILDTPSASTKIGAAELMQIVGVVARNGPRAVATGTGYVLRKEVFIPHFGPGMILRTRGVTPGFSGGPVFDGQDRIVGMLTALRNRPSGTEALVITVAEIREEARRLLSN